MEGRESGRLRRKARKRSELESSTVDKSETGRLRDESLRDVDALHDVSESPLETEEMKSWTITAGNIGKRSETEVDCVGRLMKDGDGLT